MDGFRILEGMFIGSSPAGSNGKAPVAGLRKKSPRSYGRLQIMLQ